MREIKFRAWDKEQNKMLSHEEIDQLGKDGVAHWMDIINPDNKEGVVVEQYTGLKDRNGVEIYEGDIIRAKSHSPSDYVIQFIEGGYCATHENLSDYPIDLNHFYPSVGCQIEVIGNIHTKTTSNVQP